MTVREALRRYAAVAGPGTVRQTQAIISRYFAAGGDGTDARLTRYLRDLERAGYARGTVDRHRRIIRAFYRALGARPPTALGWRYDNAIEGTRVALSRETVAGLVAAAVAGTLTHRQAALLALATTYGLRAAELAAVRDPDIDLAQGRIFVRTAKGGVQRWQYLPPALIPYLAVSWPRTTPGAVDAVFGDLCARAGVPKPAGVGWHAIRRALARDLAAAGVSDTDRSTFFRWKSGGETRTALARLYAQPTAELGPDGALLLVRPAEDLLAADAAVWAAHPYLPLWA